MHVESKVRQNQNNVVKCWIHTGSGKPGKSWNYIVAFSRTGKSWKKATGPRTFWKSLSLM